MNLAPLGRRISSWHQGRVKEVAGEFRSTIDTITTDASKALKRIERRVKKNVTKSRLLQNAVFVLLVAPLVLPLGVVMAAYSVTPAVAPVPPETVTPVTLTLSEDIVAPTSTQASIEVVESVYQANERVKQEAARALALAKPKKVTFTASAVELMTMAGIPQDQWVYVDFIINHEAGWNGTLTYNRQGSGAYGICQALPGRKMASAGVDWESNTLTQLKWCDSYAKARYGSWQNAYHFWLKKRWW